MKKVGVFIIVAVALLAASWVRADVCKLVNGSFEDDGRIDDIGAKEPNGWSVNVPAVQFAGYVFRDWVTDGIYNLTLHSKRTMFEKGAIATISQELYLADVNEIKFDLKLDTDWSEWDPNKVTAVVLIDDDIVWEPNNTGSDIRGLYLGQTCIVEDRYRDEDLHTLSLGIQVNVDEILWERYYTYWDLVQCNVYCGGGGLLAGDFNRDCYVDINDLKLAADVWLDEVDPFDRRNLFRGDDLAGYGTINFSDFAVFADGWDGNAASLGMFAEKWLHEVALNDQYNLFKDNDVKPSGSVNFRDFSILAENWLGSSYKEEDQ